MAITNFSINKQAGVALIQVLLISTIITILAIHFSFTAREQVVIASAIDDRVKASQLLKSTQSKIFYTLLTQTSFKQPSDIFPQSEAWNIYGEPFEIDRTEKSHITVVIQDHNGLLSQQYISNIHWLKVFKGLGYTDSEIQKKIGIIKDWQDNDNNAWLVGEIEPTHLENGYQYKNQPIQLPQEILWLFEQEPEKMRVIQQISTPYPVVAFNPMNAPELLLKLYFQQDIAKVIVEQRRKNTLTQKAMINFLGKNYNDVITSFVTSNEFKITVQVRYAEVQLQETVDIKIQPSENEPLLIFARY